MAAFAGRDVGKLKAKGGGKFKYMSEKDMLEIAAPFAPYRYAAPLLPLVSFLRICVSSHRCADDMG